ncbi:MAG: hypothetical protein SGBAC_007837 [Bacillariaceae sp.]
MPQPMPSETALLIAGGGGQPFVYMGNDHHHHHSKVPKDVTSAIIHSSVKVIPRCAFEGCHALTNVQFQEGVRVIGDSAFQNCTKLESVHLPSTVETVGIAAFLCCVSLREFTLNEGLVEIGCAAFTCCKSLTKISIPSTVGIIQEGTFLNCDRLEEVILPEGLTCIGNFAFANCGSLSTAPPEPIGSNGSNALPSSENDVTETKATIAKNRPRHQVPKGFKNRFLDATPDYAKSIVGHKRVITRLHSELERSRLENAQLLTKLESIVNEKDGLAVELQCYKQERQEEIEDDSSDVLSVESGDAHGEIESSLHLLEQDLHNVQPDDLGSEEPEEDESHCDENKTATTCGNTLKACLDDMVKMLGAPLRLPMKKFAEVDACMAAHHKQMMERHTFGLSSLSDPEMVQLEADFTMMHVADETCNQTEVVEEEGTGKSLENQGDKENHHYEESDDSLEQMDDHFQVTITSTGEEPASALNNDSTFEVVVAKALESNVADEVDEEDDWIADGFV